jgi:hypothetical protein
MKVVFEILGQALFEGLCYVLGKAIAVVLFPFWRVEPLSEQRSSSGWEWRGFTYQKGRHRYLYTESIQLIGVVALIFVLAALVLIVRHAT